MRQTVQRTQQLTPTLKIMAQTKEETRHYLFNQSFALIIIISSIIYSANDVYNYHLPVSRPASLLAFLMTKIIRYVHQSQSQNQIYYFVAHTDNTKINNRKNTNLHTRKKMNE